MWIFSRRLRRSRRGIQQAALFRRERQVVVSVVFEFVCVISEICGRFIGVLCAITWVLLCEELTTSQIYHMFNGRSHGNYRKRRKYYTFEFKKRLHETHLKVPRKKLQESSCKWEQSQVYLSYLECSRHCLSKKNDSYCCFLFITYANGMFSRR